MKIGELSSATGTNVETIRYYERIGLLPQPSRTAGNYRDYDPEHVDRLNFVRHARGLGFEIAQVRSLLDLGDHPDRDCGAADAIASAHLEAVDQKIRRLGQLRTELARMIEECRGGRVATCRIMQSLGDHAHCDDAHRS